MGKNQHPRLHRWLKRIGVGLLALLVVFVVFHRTIIFEGTRYFVVRAAKQQNLDLDYDISGSIFSTLSISKLVAKPTEPGPIQRLEVGNINLRYSLWGAIRKGLPALLDLVELKDVYVELTPGEPLPPKKDEKPQSFKFPALFPKLLNLENVNFVSHAKTGDTVLEGLFFSLLPDRPGVLKVRTLDIPGVRKWAGIEARTTFRDRNLLLTDLHIGPEIALDRLNLDASKLDDAELRVGLDGTLFGARTTLALHVADLNQTNRLDATVACDGLAFDAVFKYVNLPPPVSGTLRHFAIEFQGEPEKPNGWSGKMALDLTAEKIGAVTMAADLGAGRARAVFADLLDSKNRVDGWAVAALPQKLEDFAKTEADARIEIAAPDLAAFGQPVAGAAFVRTDVHLGAGKVRADVSVVALKLSTSGADLARTDVRLHAEKSLPPKAGEPPFAGLVTTLWAKIESVRSGDYATDAIELTANTRDARVEVKNVSIAKGLNRLDLQATYMLPVDFRSFEKQPVSLDLALAAPQLQAFLAPGSGAKLDGSLDVKGHAAGQNKIFDGNFAITGRGIAAAGLTVRTIDGLVEVAKNRANISKMDVVLDDKNSLRLGGGADLTGNYPYQGTLDVTLDDLAKFQPLLGGKTPLGGSLKVAWRGEGDAKQHQGTLALDLAKAQYADQKNLSAHIAASYAPDYIDVRDLRASAGTLGDLSLALFWKDQRLRLSNLLVRQQKLTLLEGSLEMPLVLAKYAQPAELVPADQPLSVTLRTKDLNVRTLLQQLGQKGPPMSGMVNLDVSASGTLHDLIASVRLRADRMQSAAAKDVAPADVAVNLNLRDDRLNLDGTVYQKLIQPLAITGNIPLDIEQLIEKKALDPATPVNLRATLPRSSLEFVSALVPMIRQSRGTAAVDVRVDGTIAKPALAGSVDVDWNALRFADPSLPPINDFALRLGFTPQRVAIERCRGGIAGGSFGASGGVDFKQLDNPTLALRFATRDALVLQNDDMTARVTSDVRVDGPLKAATVSGTVFVTRSRFFKDIDILPIGLPGRPAPQPPAEPTVISFPTPPLRDWKFDLAIKTSDPFLVQSNLANGKIIIDLHLGGTGLDPWMEGSVRIEKLTASLPFSRLNIDDGTIYFARDEPFSPKLNIRGTSEIRDYHVAVNIYGSASDPQAAFSSDPPLPQADVVALIATGTTTEELGKDPNALAGRAAMLLFQKLSRTIFKPKPGAERKDTFLSRVQLDVGASDPKTGRQSVAARVPLTDQFALVGGVDVGGNFRGQVKYLIRFR